MRNAKERKTEMDLPCRRFLNVTDEYDGENFFTMVDGVREATPLLLVLAVIELSDVVFAVDSIPAVRFLSGLQSPAYSPQQDGVIVVECNGRPRLSCVSLGLRSALFPPGRCLE